MAISLSSAANSPPCLKPLLPKTLSSFHTKNGRSSSIFSIKCESSADNESAKRLSKLEIGSPIVVVEAPKMIKTAASVPCLRVNSGLVNPGDVGRIVSRKPKDVWAVRLSIGTYLIDGKYFKPLDVDK
ncbi:hypothetical protein L484_000099 [Morus notabilis]|uniref:Chlororespiratory reduction 42 n=1 Tax=Morus notabilis TaxID=981085 RepID=W9RP34_9ROSA|nr:uncharacterized protein LOC21384253 [Morus notabilis]XP_010097634.1 uncharacterized protein LOC21383744 [Morus notabilis]EXB62999.1 hypothetical protein L484_000626 [Morus notabilis]EXC43435.1 hypothetical protein L484_000099 [Morus notabilis]